MPQVSGWFPDLLTTAGGANRPRGWLTTVAEQEGAESVLVYRSRADAVLAVLTGLTNPGGHVVAGEDCADLVVDGLLAEGRTVTSVAAAAPDAVFAAIRDTTQVIFLSSLVEPAMRLTPVNEISAVAHGEDLLVVVDNSVLTPASFRPLDSGAHVAIVDWTGHGIDMSTVAGSDHLLRLLPPGDSDLSAPPIGSVLDRVRQRSDTASAVAAALAGHRLLRRVERAGFAEHPWARETHDGFGPVLVVSCAVDPAPAAAALAGADVTATVHPLDPSALRITVRDGTPERITAVVDAALTIAAST